MTGKNSSDLHLWSPALYGNNAKFLGPVHGFAGNVLPLIEGRSFLNDRTYAEIASRATATASRTAFVDGDLANWPAVYAEIPADRLALHKSQLLTQHCHGAPGMLTALSRLPVGNEEFDQILLKGGELVWQADPLKKGSNLCHGTGGNGYALLKLFQRTSDEMWLERARLFAMNAMAQYELATESYGQGRHSLWTGDLGLAVYLWDCLREETQFPTIEAF